MCTKDVALEISKPYWTEVFERNIKEIPEIQKTTCEIFKEIISKNKLDEARCLSNKGGICKKFEVLEEIDIRNTCLFVTLPLLGSGGALMWIALAFLLPIAAPFAVYVLVFTVGFLAAEGGMVSGVGGLVFSLLVVLNTKDLLQALTDACEFYRKNGEILKLNIQKQIEDCKENDELLNRLKTAQEELDKILEFYQAPSAPPMPSNAPSLFGAINYMP